MKFVELFRTDNVIITGRKKATELTYNIQLPIPFVIIYDDGLAKWGKINNAINYNVKINGSTIYNTFSNEYLLGIGDSIEVQAVGEGVYLDSEWSVPQTYYGISSQGLDFISNNDGTCYVSGIGRCEDSVIRIPTMNGNERVTSIGRMAFVGCDITGVTIPGGIISIGEYAFRKCLNLNTIAISNTVSSIENYAFYGCQSLTTLIVPKGVTYIGTGAFQNCTKLTSVELSETVDIVGRNAFMGCTSLRRIVIPEGVHTIKRNAFQDCERLVDIKLAESVNTLESGLLLGCTSLKDFTIPARIDNIGNAIFSKCSNIENITIESQKLARNIKTIGSRMFSECENLLTVTVPELIEIGTYAFYKCGRLAAINYGGDTNSWHSIIFGKDWNREIGNYEVKCINGIVGG